MKGLRGTLFDPFGYTHERRFERKLIADYRALMTRVVDQVDQRTLPTATELASAAYDVRGYGPVKDASITEYEARLQALLNAFENPAKAPRPTRQPAARGVA